MTKNKAAVAICKSHAQAGAAVKECHDLKSALSMMA